MKVSSTIRSIPELEGMARAGFDSVVLDLGAFCPASYFEKYGKDDSALLPDKKREQFQNFLERQDGIPALCDVVRAPHISWNTDRTDLYELLLQVGKDSIEACARAGGRNIIIQPLFLGENRRYYLELGKTAHQKGVRILLENQCKNINGHFVRGVCTDARTVLEWIDFLNDEFQDEEFGFCLDFSTCHICRQDAGEMAAALGKCLKAVQIRLGDDAHDAGSLPVIGIKAASNGMHDWTDLICGLRKTAFEGNLIIDAGRTLTGFSHLLRPQLYPLIKSVSDFFRWQIELEKPLKKYADRVLFGAGRMCQNYLEHYGKQYPPLFVCDNNPGLWNTKICGFDVKPPETLKEIPEDCAVIICNTFYEETANQLRKLGVKNIEAFNDEYLPARACLKN